MTDDTSPLDGETEVAGEVHSAVELKSRPAFSPFYPRRDDSSVLLHGEAVNYQNFETFELTKFLPNI